MTSTAGEALLEVRDLVVDFDGFKAINGLDFFVREGELRFLIGPNGAGKTTLIDVVTGLTKPAEGRVRFSGQEVSGRREHEIVRLGIGRNFQTATVFEKLTVLENLDLAASFRRPMTSMLRRAKDVDVAVSAAIEAVGLEPQATQLAGALSHGQKQWLEIGMLLAQKPQLLLLDEPVAGMSPEERVRTGELLQTIARNHTVVVVEHDMTFLRRFATTVTVLHEGSVLCEGSVAEVQSDPKVQEVYLGRPRDGRRSSTVQVS